MQKPFVSLYTLNLDEKKKIVQLKLLNFTRNSVKVRIMTHKRVAQKFLATVSMASVTKWKAKY